MKNAIRKKSTAIGLLFVLILTLLAGCGDAASSVPELSPEEIKEQASEYDLKIFVPVRAANASYEKFMDMIANLGTQYTLYDVYSYCDTIKNWHYNSWGKDYPDIRDKSASDYKEVSEDYFDNVYVLAIYFQKYIDEDDQKALINARYTINALPSQYEDVISARTDYLKNAGFTDDEVAERFALG